MFFYFFVCTIEQTVKEVKREQCEGNERMQTAESKETKQFFCCLSFCVIRSDEKKKHECERKVEKRVSATRSDRPSRKIQMIWNTNIDEVCQASKSNFISFCLFHCRRNWSLHIKVSRSVRVLILLVKSDGGKHIFRHCQHHSIRNSNLPQRTHSGCVNQRQSSSHSRGRKNEERRLCVCVNTCLCLIGVLHSLSN